MLTLREPGLGPTWGLDAEHPPAIDAHEGTDEHIREAHRDRHTVDCGNTGKSRDYDILQRLVGDASPLESNGSDSDQPAEAPHEPAPPPHPAAMGNASPVRGLGGAADSVMTEGVELVGVSVGLDEGVAPGSAGAEVAPADGFAKPEHKVGSFLHGLVEVCVPAAPHRKNPLIRRKLVPANVAACVIGAAATRMFTKTAYVSPRHVACERTTGNNVLSMANSQVYLRPKEGWQVTDEQGGATRLIELADLPLHKSIGLVLRRVGEDMNDSLLLAELLQ